MKRSIASAICLSVLTLNSSVAGEKANWSVLPGYRHADLQPAPAGEPGFTRLGAETGIVFTNQLAKARYTTNQNILNGSGVAAGDIDGDGWPDLFLCGLDNPNALYRNLGNWRFEEIASAAGVALAGLDCTGAAFADLDGDGDLDLVVNTFGQGTRILVNDGRGRFSPGPILNPRRAGMSLALGDIDGDGDLDLYIANYRLATVRDEPASEIKGDYVGGKMVLRSYNGVPVTDPALEGRFTLGQNGKVVEHGEIDMLYRNDGALKFTHLRFDSDTFRDEHGKPLASLPRDWGLSAMFRDINGDGAPDLYVCNDFESPDRIWINDGKGRFQALSTLAVRHTCMFSMGVDFADFNRDGHLDFFVADMLSRDRLEHHTRDRVPYPPSAWETRPQFANNMLYLNRGDFTFAEVAWLSGVESSGWTWSPAALDIDLDGWEDLLVTTGNQLDSIDLDVINHASELKKGRNFSREDLLNLRHLFRPLRSPNQAFRNERNLAFSDRSVAWRFNADDVSHGMAFADLDLDGDLDVIVNNMNGPVGLYRNDAAAGRVAVRLRGAGGNTRGAGAMIHYAGAPVAQQQEMLAGGRYLSGDDPVRTFAASEDGGRIEVQWRNGRKSVVENVKAGRVYEIFEEENDALASRGAAPAPERGGGANRETPWFEDISSTLNHSHGDEPFDDFARQPLLPFRLSQLGPGVTWHDFDQDGWDDLVLPSGRGGRLALFRNNGRGGLTNFAEPVLQRPVARDQTTAIGVGKALLIGSSNYEDGMTNGGWIRVFDFERKVGGESILGPEAATGPMAAADVNGDGALDLFIGGRAIAGRYPEAATSILFRNEASRFIAMQRFDKIGLVSGAVFSDLDLDGDPDLALACQHGPVRVFRNDRGKFTEVTAELGLSELTGLWNGIATGDLDGDGRPDLIVSNWGLNTPWRASRETPLKLFYGDLDGNGTIDMIEAQFDHDLKKEVPLRILKSVGPALPYVQEKMRTFAAYSSASVPEIFGDKILSAPVLHVNTLSSMVFFNRGNKFEARPLPVEAQFSPAFGVAVADLNGDGADDVLLSQNFFQGNVETPRSDAGRALVLRGDGKGNLTPVPGQVSGVKVYGEQRGCAVSDFDQDGRVDLVIAQNGAPTKLYRNTAARPGARVILPGTPENPAAVGTLLKFKGANGGITREVQAGSGYWSVNGAVHVFAGGGELTVRLPDQREIKATVPEDAARVRIHANGQVEIAKR